LPSPLFFACGRAGPDVGRRDGLAFRIDNGRRRARVHTASLVATPRTVMGPVSRPAWDALPTRKIERRAPVGAQ